MNKELKIVGSMTQRKERHTTVEKNALADDAILRETVKMENRYRREFTEFQPSLMSLRDATPDKPLIRSFCSSQHQDDDFTEEDKQMLKTLHMDVKETDPKKKYAFPMTTSQEIGWDAYEYKPRSIFDHRHRNTDITTTPTHYDPLSGNASGIKTMKK